MEHIGLRAQIAAKVHPDVVAEYVLGRPQPASAHDLTNHPRVAGPHLPHHWKMMQVQASTARRNADPAVDSALPAEVCLDAAFPASANGLATLSRAAQS